MGWSIGFDSKWQRDIGYGVPAVCDHPDCDKEINRGLGYVCGGSPHGGDDGCGLFFCEQHGYVDDLCERCSGGKEPFEPKPDTEEWRNHKKTHESWRQWREENPELAAAL